MNITTSLIVLLFLFFLANIYTFLSSSYTWQNETKLSKTFFLEFSTKQYGRMIHLTSTRPFFQIFNFKYIWMINLTKWNRTLSNVLKINSRYYEGARPVIVTAELDVLKHILVKDFPKFCDRKVMAKHISYRMIN